MFEITKELSDIIVAQNQVFNRCPRIYAQEKKERKVSVIWLSTYNMDALHELSHLIITIPYGRYF